MGFIYSILNKRNGKIYVGQTIQGEKRFKKHKSELNNNTHSNIHLQNAWNKYGSDSFEFNVLENCSDDKLNDNEIWWIDYFDSTNPQKGYNLQSGGAYNYVVSDETRRKQSKALKGIVRSPEYCKKLSDSRKGMEFTETHKSNISKSKSSKLNSVGYYRVYLDKDSRYAQGFRYSYRWRDEDKSKKITSVSLNKLKEKVLSHGLLWCKIEDLSNG